MKQKPQLVNILTALIIIWVGHFFVDLMIGFWFVYKSLAHLDLAMAGIIAGISPFIGEGMQVIFGSLGDRGYRKVLLISGLGACSAATLLPYTENYFLLFLLFLITCIGSGAFIPTAVAVASSMTQNRKGLFVTIFASGGAAGLAFSQFIFTSLYVHYNGSTVLLSLPILLLMCVIYFIELPGAPHQPAPEGKQFGFSAMKKLFRHRELVILYTSQVCNQAVYWGTIFLLPDVLATKGYESWISFGGGHFFYVVGAVMMMVPGGMLSDKYPPKLVLLIASLSGFLLYYLFLFTPIMSNVGVLSLLFCLGACLGTSNPVAVSLGNKLVPSRPGLISAFLMGLVWCISESIGPGGGGLLTKCFVENAPTKALSCFGVLFMAEMAVTLCLPNKVSDEIQIEFA